MPNVVQRANIILMTSTASPATTFEVLGTCDDVTQCQLCGRDDLRATIALAVVEHGDRTGEVVYYGSDCGARAAGWGYGGARRVRDAAAAADRKAARDAERAAEIRAAYTEALEFFQAGEDGEHPQLIRARQTFHRGGGFDALGAFPAWLAGVAATGDLG